MDVLAAVVYETFRTLYLAAPYLLFGLLVAGFLHVLLPAAKIQRWMGRPGIRGVALAAGVGVPLPVCSCGVVPITVEMRRKGASQAASMAFLTTTPESSIDSILFTWGLMGPVMAVARPLAAFVTAVLGGTLAIFSLAERSPDDAPAATSCACDDGCAAPAAVPREGGGLWRRIVRPSLRYGFGELLDDLAFWLLIGVVLAGVLGAVVPADLGALGLGSGLMPMVLLLAVGVPIYMCASASTPIAAALMAKGVSPGAALVFLLAGPATNLATLVLLTRTFGRRFVAVYLASVVAGALAAGLALDALVAGLGWRIAVPLTAPGESPWAVLEWTAFAVLAALLVASLWRGSGRAGWRELRAGFTGLWQAG